MNRLHAIRVLRHWDKKGVYVFTKRDLAKLFPDDSKKTLEEGLRRLVANRILLRAWRGVYVNENANSHDAYTVERVAKAMRRGEYNYVSLESMLSEYGVISQIPVDRLTVMTTGRKGRYKTLYGVIEFTHTKRSLSDILDSMKKIENRPLRIATKEAALRDLKRVGRNLSLIDGESL